MALLVVVVRVPDAVVANLEVVSTMVLAEGFNRLCGLQICKKQIKNGC